MDRDTRQDESVIDVTVDSSSQQVTNGGGYKDDDDYGHSGRNHDNDHNDDDRYNNDDDRNQQYSNGNGNDDVNSAGEIEQDGEIIQQPDRSERHHNSSNNNNDTMMNDESSSSLALRPLFFGNLIPNYSTDQINNIFEHPYKIDTLPNKEELQPIPVDRIDIKRGYCFVFFKDATSMQDKQRIESFCMTINGIAVPNVSRAIRAEFARGDGRVKKMEDERRKNITPSETLFVVNFHELTTKKEDLELLFEKYGKLVRIDLKRNYAFVQYSTVEEATKAKEATNGGRLDQSILSVEYVARQRSHNSNSTNPSSSNNNNNNRNRSHGNDRDRMDSRDRNRLNDRNQGGNRNNNLDRDGSSRYNNPPALYDDRGGRGGMISTANSNRPIDSFRGRSDYRDRPPVNEFDSYRPTIYDNDRYTDRRASRDSPPPAPLYNHHHHHQRSGRSRSRSPPSYRRRSPLRGGGGIPPDDDRMIHNDYRSRGRSPPRGGGGSVNMDHRRNLSPPDRFRGSYDRDHRGYRG